MMTAAKVPIARPKLPGADTLKPYLDEIDANRVYSNFGPLLVRFQDRLARHFGLEGDQVLVLSNATLALQLALNTVCAERKLCLMPSWTFVATPHAAVSAGMEPYFVDVDARTMALDAGHVARVAEGLRGEVGAVIVVAPFGAPLDFGPWIEFQDRTGIPVVLDCAAGFDTVRPSKIPTVVSLHATKAMGVGEGAFVVCERRDTIAEMTKRANFGFLGSRSAELAATNAKMSEYQAAVGHAALDSWSEARDRFKRAAMSYRDRLASGRVALQSGFGDRWIASTCVVHLLDETAAPAARRLEAAGIETRAWWQKGAHLHPAFAKFRHEPLPATDSLAETTLGLPFFSDISETEIARICARLLARDGA